MPKEKRNFVNGEIYHIVLRRIGKELLFKDIDDYYRGIFYLYECNDKNPVDLRQRREARARYKKQLKKLNKGQTFVEWQDKREKLVEILAFCLMPNHFHLLLRQLKDNGISKFIQKIASGYANYFKKKYKIKFKGYFFQDRFSAVHVKGEDQLKAVFVYIHTNPVLLIEPDWKVKGIKNLKRAKKFLQEYKWSSYQDYLGKKNFPSLTERDFISGIIGDEKNSQNLVNDWLEFKRGIRKLLEKFASLSLEN